jgi:aminoglycoside phosphotransferase (APT) family kinase protein
MAPHDAAGRTQEELGRVVLDLLRRECPEVEITSLHLLDKGYTSRNWVADTDGGRFLCKVPQRHTDPVHLRRLVEGVRLAAEHGVPVVHYRRVIPYEPAVDGPLIIQEYQDGDAADDVWDSLDDERRTVLVQDLGEVVGRLHSLTGPHFGDLVDGRRAPTLEEWAGAEVESLLAQARLGPETDIDALRSAIGGIVARLDSSAGVPVFTHGDLWLPNLLVRDGRIACVLDLEHALYADRFRDFGKLDQHVFGRFPAGRDAFLKSYDAVRPLPDDWEQRVELGHIMHALTMHAYFLRWTPQLAPFYTKEIGNWLARHG